MRCWLCPYLKRPSNGGGLLSLYTLSLFVLSFEGDSSIEVVAYATHFKKA